MTTMPLLDNSTLLEFVGRWHAAWNSHDPWQVARLCTDDIEWEDPAQYSGPDAVAAVLRMLTRPMPAYRFASTEPPLLDAARGVAILPWRCEGTMTGTFDPPGFAPTGGPVAFAGDDHRAFRGGRVSRCRVVYDMTGIARQIGALPAHPVPRPAVWASGCSAALPVACDAATARPAHPYGGPDAPVHYGVPPHRTRNRRRPHRPRTPGSGRDGLDRRSAGVPDREHRLRLGHPARRQRRDRYR